LESINHYKYNYIPIRIDVIINIYSIQNYIMLIQKSKNVCIFIDIFYLGKIKDSKYNLYMVIYGYNKYYDVEP